MLYYVFIGVKMEKSRLKDLNLSHTCDGDICPNAYIDDNGDMLLQGYKISNQLKSVFKISDNEDVVRLPQFLVAELIQKLQL